MFSEVRDLLSPVVEKVPDNLIAQRLLADSCFQLGFVTDALHAYKMLLYFNPADREIANLVQELETQAVQSGGLLKGEHQPKKLRSLMKLQKLLSKAQQAQGQLVRS